METENTSLEKMNKKELIREIRRERGKFWCAEIKLGYLQGFITSIGCWDLFMRASRADNSRIDKEELIQIVNSLPVCLHEGECPRCGGDMVEEENDDSD